VQLGRCVGEQEDPPAAALLEGEARERVHDGKVRHTRQDRYNPQNSSLAGAMTCGRRARLNG